MALKRRIWFRAGETFTPVPNCLMRLDQIGESIAAANGSYFAPRFFTAQRSAEQYFAPKILSLVAPSLPEAVPEELIEEAKTLRVRIIVLAKDENSVAPLRKRFETSSVSLDLVARKVVSTGPISFELFVFQVAGLKQPVGSFLTTCKELELRDRYVFATCQRNPTIIERAWRRLKNWRNGFARESRAPEYWGVRTSLEFSGCVGDIANSNGVLACALAPGTAVPAP